MMENKLQPEKFTLRIFKWTEWHYIFRFIKLGVTADSLEGMYKKCHAAIRADPALKSAAKKDVTKKRWNAKKIGLAARKAKVAKAKAEFLSQIEAQKE